MRNTTGKTSDLIQISLGKHGRNRFIPIGKITIVLMVGGHGCARQAVITPAPKPPAQTSPEAIPSAPSKGIGMTKRIPINVKTGDRLVWVENALKIYPPDRFLTSLAMALNRKQAEQRSLAEPEKPFALSITDRTKMQIKAMGAFPERWIENFTSLL